MRYTAKIRNPATANTTSKPDGAGVREEGVGNSVGVGVSTIGVGVVVTDREGVGVAATGVGVAVEESAGVGVIPGAGFSSSSLYLKINNAPLGTR